MQSLQEVLIQLLWVLVDLQALVQLVEVLLVEIHILFQPELLVAEEAAEAVITPIQLIRP
jgi:hypothetical protein